MHTKFLFYYFIVSKATQHWKVIKVADLYKVGAKYIWEAFEIEVNYSYIILLNIHNSSTHLNIYHELIMFLINIFQPLFCFIYSSQSLTCPCSFVMCNQTEQKKISQLKNLTQKNDDSVDHNGPSIPNTPKCGHCLQGKQVSLKELSLDHSKQCWNFLIILEIVWMRYLRQFKMMHMTV